MAYSSNVVDAPLFKKIYDLSQVIHTNYIKIPKFYRHTLWQQCASLTLELIRDMVKAYRVFEEERLATLHTMSDNLDLLKVLVRLTKDSQAIQKKPYVEIEMMLQEVGRMLGGWIKSCAK
ncbi:four helix bundle protein [Candidatus Neptunochlamydia vexilliferae]|uniref:bAvd-like domain-containing protein n=1 Tax=Candidatus Neptunichlamydia vexilliferae TaxID=1651774 RepID=A0ABS0AZ59_9BACT|nr:four helix bundle protein [Candidatus Neptunochlamydia vexilliferae]MBF5059417.1 hypothetical protein [Candidatus Neptunochlamydia vexilliferae]